MTYEEIGKMFFNFKKAKFPGPLLRHGLIRYKNGEDNNLENFELTPLGISFLTNEEYIPVTKKDSSFLEEYISRFTTEKLGINKRAYSPESKVREKLDNFFLKNNVTKQEVLDAVDHYHNEMRNDGKITFSLDAQYFIEKDGGSLMIDIINNDVRKGKNVNYSDKLVF